MLKILIPLGIVGLGLMIYSLIEATQTPRHRVRVLPKTAWLAVILLVPIIGAGLWLGFGRAQSRKDGGSKTKKAPTAPDDDPEFLRQVEFRRRQQQRRDEEARKKAEEDRKRRSRSQSSPEAQAQQEGSGGPSAGNNGRTGAPGHEGAAGNSSAGSDQPGTGDEAASKDPDDGETPGS